MDLKIISTVAQILGVSLQSIDFINKRWKIDDDNPLRLLCIMYSPMFSWKSIHLHYCTLTPSMDKLLNVTNNGNGLPKKSVQPSTLQTVFQDANLYRAVLNIKDNLETAFNEINLSFRGQDISRKINEINEEKIRVALRRINDQKNNVIAAHKRICDFFLKVSDFIDKQRWDDTDAAFILSHRRIYKDDCKSIVDSTDIVIMELLNIYDVAFNALGSTR